MIGYAQRKVPHLDGASVGVSMMFGIEKEKHTLENYEMIEKLYIIHVLACGSMPDKLFVRMFLYI